MRSVYGSILSATINPLPAARFPFPHFLSLLGRRSIMASMSGILIPFIHFFSFAVINTKIYWVDVPDKLSTPPTPRPILPASNTSRGLWVE